MPPTLKIVDQIKKVGAAYVPDLARLLEEFQEWYASNYIQPVHLFDDNTRELGVVSVRDAVDSLVFAAVTTIPGAATEVSITQVVPPNKKWRIRAASMVNETSNAHRRIFVTNAAGDGVVLTDEYSVGISRFTSMAPADVPLEAGMTIQWKHHGGVAADVVSVSMLYQEDDA